MPFIFTYYIFLSNITFKFETIVPTIDLSSTRRQKQSNEDPKLLTVLPCFGFSRNQNR
jgi:hypothetical protein